MVRGKTPEEPKGLLIGYARVSTEDQSLDLQLDALRRAGVPDDHIHVDKKSGAQAERKGLNRALKDVDEGDTLVVWKLDRLTRSTLDLYKILERLDAKGVGFRSLTEALDTTTPAGRLILGVLAVIAQFERELISQRTSAGIQAMKAARAKGKQWKWGRKPVMTPKKIVRAGKLLNAGKSGPLVAKMLEVSTASIYAYWKFKKLADGTVKFVRKPKAD